MRVASSTICIDSPRCSIVYPRLSARLIQTTIIYWRWPRRGPPNISSPATSAASSLSSVTAMPASSRPGIWSRFSEYPGRYRRAAAKTAIERAGMDPVFPGACNPYDIFPAALSMQGFAPVREIQGPFRPAEQATALCSGLRSWQRPRETHTRNTAWSGCAGLTRNS